MQKRFTVCVLTMLSITCGAALAAQLTPAQRIDRVTTLLKSLETRDLRPLAYIGSSYTQHNLQVADGPAGVRELVLHPPAATTVHTVRIFTDGDYVVAQTDYNFGGPKVGFDVFRFDGDKIVEHWDNLQEKCAAPNPSGRTQLDGPTKVTDVDQTDAKVVESTSLNHVPQFAEACDAYLRQEIEHRKRLSALMQRSQGEFCDDGGMDHNLRRV